VLVGRGFDPAQQVLSVDLMRILLVTPVLFGLSGLLMGVQNARGRFLIPALAPTCYWLGMIVGLLLWVPGRGIYGLAWGAVLGAFMYLGLQVAGLWGQHAPYTPALGLSDPAVRRVGRLMGPRLLGVAANQLAFLVTTVLASYVAGGVSALDYAWRVFTMPQVVIAQGLAVAALPAFSALVARGELDEVRERLADTLIGMLFLAVPATVGLVLLREPIVAMLFQRGSFGPESTAAVAAALGFFSLGLIGHSTVEIVSRAFYALQDTRTPVLVAGYTVLANVALGLGLLLAFTRAGFQPVGGLALATSLAVTLEMVALVVLLRRRLSGIGFARIGPAVARMGAAALVMAVLVAGWLALTSGTGPWIIGLGGAVVGVAVYWSAALGLGSPEARAATEALRSRRRRRPVPGPRRHTRRFAPGTSRPPRSEEQDPP
jgi:putative peptidoglycan lipid II flippase